MVARDTTMRIGETAGVVFFAAALAAAAISMPGIANAQSPDRVAHAPARATPTVATDLSAQRRTGQRSPTRLRIHPRYTPDGVYPRYNPGPNAVRDCTATYVQEFRPSGTVIVPRMNCFWRQG